MTKALPHSRKPSRPTPRSVSRRKRATPARPAARRAPSRQALRTRRKFLRHFPGGFRDETYLDWERDYKWNAHLRWQDNLSEASFRRLLARGQFDEIAKRASGLTLTLASRV